MTDPIPFEDALGELQQIVSSLEAGQVNLEESLVQFERGVSLVSYCHSLLDQAHQRVEIVVGKTVAGAVETAPFDVSATYNGDPTAKTDEDIPTRAARPKRRKSEPDHPGLFS